MIFHDKTALVLFINYQTFPIFKNKLQFQLMHLPIQNLKFLYTIKHRAKNVF